MTTCPELIDDVIPDDDGVEAVLVAIVNVPDNEPDFDEEEQVTPNSLCGLDAIFIDEREEELHLSLIALVRVEGIILKKCLGLKNEF